MSLEDEVDALYQVVGKIAAAVQAQERERFARELEAWALAWPNDPQFAAALKTYAVAVRSGD